MGTLLAGRYRVTGLLGGGGMAVVYKATDEDTGRTVAVKVLRSEYVADGAFLRRLRREAEAVCRLSHPGVVPVLDVAEDDGRPFLVLRYVEGITLKEHIRRAAPMPEKEAVNIACQVLSVLEHAHQQGVIHRDIKPQNILLTPDDQVMVTDFGIARASGATTTVVDNGAMVGTAQYFAPEQARGLPAGERSDLYAVGVILFEMLTGRLPFDGDTPVAVAMQHLEQAPPRPSLLNRAVSPALEAIVLKALAKDPARRYASAGAMRADLERFLAGLPVEAALDDSSVGDTVVAEGLDLGPRRREEPDPGRPSWGRRPPRRPAATTGDGSGSHGEVSGALALSPQAEGPDPGDEESPGRGGPEAASQRRAGVEEASAEPGAAPLSGEGGARSPGRQRRLWQILGTAVLLLALVLAGVAARRWLQPPVVSVPMVQGLALIEAQNRLERAGLRWEVREERYHRSEINTVIAQEPQAGVRVRMGQTVSLVVSKGPRWLAVPDVRGLNERDARLRLENQGLLAEIRYRHDEAAPGTVVEQEPGPGIQVQEGMTVYLTVSQGQEASGVVVPSLFGLTEAEAAQEIQRAGLQVGRRREEPSPYPRGTVIGQEPAAAANVQPGQAVHLVISSGPAAPPTTHETLVQAEVTGQGPHVLRVEVEDADGRRLVYEQTHQGPEEVAIPVTWRGEVAHLAIYLDDQLLEQRTLRPDGSTEAAGEDR